MNKDRARQVVKLTDEADSYDGAVANFPTFLLLIAAEVADMAKEWEEIAYLDTPAARERRLLICASTYDLNLYTTSEARLFLRLNKDTALELPGIINDVYTGDCGDNPLPKTPEQMEGTIDIGDLPHLDPEPTDEA